MKVLVIEDDVSSAQLLKSVLDSDHEVIMANRAKDGIDAGLRYKPDLIISDWDLKDEIDGIDVCMRITESHKAPVIFVSGSPLEELKEVADVLSPIHILSKPIDFENLLHLIDEIRA